MSDTTTDEIGRRLASWARDRFGADARIAGAKSLGGHSQVTVGFELQVPGRETERLVLKTPPPGVTAQNNFDVLRQVPVLQALAAQGVPAPQARYWSGDPAAFGGPYLMMSRLAGSSPSDVFTDDAGRGIVDADRQFGDAVSTLVRIHSIGEPQLQGWGVARGVADEIDHWVKVVRKSSDEAWVAQAMRVRELLHAGTPPEVPIGLVHGDYYTNNWVFDGPRLTGVVDWEGASIGPMLLDLGWLCTMYDPPSWGPLRRRRMGWHPGPERFIEWYRAASPLDLTHIDWYRALAAYRLACITAYYYERHRTGRRHNPAWDVLGEAFPHLLEQAASRLGE
ncbi:MAG TPA: phosphotransferase family protein [Burkholderiaceae bacterium]|nr:phosphotransferase family protein [Burkholderiaceae bacterium]